MSEDEAKKFIKTFDIDDDGEINQEEWRQLVQTIMEEYSIVEAAPSASASTKGVQREVTANASNFKSTFASDEEPKPGKTKRKSAKQK